MVLTCCLSLLLVVNRYGGAMLAAVGAALLAWLVQWLLPDGLLERILVIGVALAYTGGLLWAVLARTTHTWRVEAPTGRDLRGSLPRCCSRSCWCWPCWRP